MENKYTKEDVLKLIDMYKLELDKDFKDRINSLEDNNYDITKITRKAVFEKTTGEKRTIMFTVFSHIELKHIFNTAYEDIPLLINDEYVIEDESIALILKWRLQLGK